MWDTVFAAPYLLMGEFSGGNQLHDAENSRCSRAPDRRRSIQSLGVGAIFEDDASTEKSRPCKKRCHSHTVKSLISEPLDRSADPQPFGHRRNLYR